MMSIAITKPSGRKEAWYAGVTGDPVNTLAYFTIPAYNRLRETYPGYGRTANDTSKDFILSGNTFRRDSSDLSIRSIQAAYTDEFLLLAIRIRDDYVMGGRRKTTLMIASLSGSTQSIPGTVIIVTVGFSRMKAGRRSFASNSIR